MPQSVFPKVGGEPFFRAKAEKLATETGAPGLIYAIEEPETSQHPTNQRKLMNAFAELSEAPDCQIILSTHTPVMARLLPAESLRHIGVAAAGCAVSDDAYRSIAKSLGVLPDHDVKLFIGVEGANDINFLKTLSGILANADEDVPDLGRLENDGKIIFFPLGGSNLVLWQSRLAGLNRPEYYIFDRDEQPHKASRYQATVDALNARANCKARVTGKRELENYIHPDAIKAAQPTVSVTFGDFDDVPLLVAETVHTLSGGKAWASVDDEEKKKSRVRKFG